MDRHCNGLSREVAESLYLEVCRMCECDSKGDGLVMGLGRSGCWLDMIILKVFSSLDDSTDSVVSLLDKQQALASAVMRQLSLVAKCVRKAFSFHLC